MKNRNAYTNEYFINRELSWLEFNHRVLEEAKDKSNPLLERLKFSSIASSNLDEFFMIRVASLKDQVNANYTKTDLSGLTPKEQLDKISKRVRRMVYEQYNTYNRAFLPQLRKSGINIVRKNELTNEERNFVEQYFMDVIFPVLTPMAVDSSRPFPAILGKTLNIAMYVKDNKNTGDKIFAIVQVPLVLPRLIQLPLVNNTEKRYVILEEIIMMFVEKLFCGYDVVSAYCFRITRNADLTIEEEEAEDLLKEIEKSLKRRKTGAAIRLEVEADMDEGLKLILSEALEINESEIYRIKGPLDLTFLSDFLSVQGYDHLKYPAHKPRTPKDLLNEDDMFKAIRKQDIMMFHPFESFDPVIEFINRAANDSKVLSIKQTLYRVSGDSPIIKSLQGAAERGKQVTVLVEVMARFDEENNIKWAKELEQAGCHVVYGLVGLKTHSKITLVVRMESEGVRRYVHLGTGNYNDITARFYTDIGLFTCRESFGEDATSLFNMLTGCSDVPNMSNFYLAPFNLKFAISTLIKNEAENAKLGKKARIIIKMNALVDTAIIQELYEASRAGVQIELIIRGICCLRPGVCNLSENISVRSIVGRFLEHTRLLYFYNDGEEKIYITSADLMPRNLYRRVELMFEVKELAVKSRLIKMLHIILDDTVKARLMSAEGVYKKIDKRGKKNINSQDFFIENDLVDEV